MIKPSGSRELTIQTPFLFLPTIIPTPHFLPVNTGDVDLMRAGFWIVAGRQQQTIFSKFSSTIAGNMPIPSLISDAATSQFTERFQSRLRFFFESAISDSDVYPAPAFRNCTERQSVRVVSSGLFVSVQCSLRVGPAAPTTGDRVQAIEEERAHALAVRALLARARLAYAGHEQLRQGRTHPLRRRL